VHRKKESDDEARSWALLLNPYTKYVHAALHSVSWALIQSLLVSLGSPTLSLTHRQCTGKAHSKKVIDGAKHRTEVSSIHSLILISGKHQPERIVSQVTNQSTTPPIPYTDHACMHKAHTPTLATLWDQIQLGLDPSEFTFW